MKRYGFVRGVAVLLVSLAIGSTAGISAGAAEIKAENDLTI